MSGDASQGAEDLRRSAEPVRRSSAWTACISLSVALWVSECRVVVLVENTAETADELAGINLRRRVWIEGSLAAPGELLLNGSSLCLDIEAGICQ